MKQGFIAVFKAVGRSVCKLIKQGIAGLQCFGEAIKGMVLLVEIGRVISRITIRLGEERR
jgi:hypothetical protein